MWLFILLLAFGMWAWNRAGARAAGRPQRPVHPLFVGGLIVLWLSLDWPIGALGAGYLASVHMLQFLLMALVAPPMLLMGPSPDALALLERPGLGRAIIGKLVSPFPALVTFSVVVLRDAPADAGRRDDGHAAGLDGRSTCSGSARGSSSGGP